MNHEDRMDRRRLAWLKIVLDRMASCEREDCRIRVQVGDLLDLKRSRGLMSEDHAQRWKTLLEMDADELRRVLLAPGTQGRELRHAHLFAGVLPPKEQNRILRDIRKESGGGAPGSGQTDMVGHHQ